MHNTLLAYSGGPPANHLTFTFEQYLLLLKIKNSIYYANLENLANNTQLIDQEKF